MDIFIDWVETPGTIVEFTTGPTGNTGHIGTFDPFNATPKTVINTAQYPDTALPQTSQTWNLETDLIPPPTDADQTVLPCSCPQALNMGLLFAVKPTQPRFILRFVPETATQTSPESIPLSSGQQSVGFYLRPAQESTVRKMIGLDKHVGFSLGETWTNKILTDLTAQIVFNTKPKP